MICGGAFLVGAVVVGVLGTETRGRALADALERPGGAAGDGPDDRGRRRPGPGLATGS